MEQEKYSSFKYKSILDIKSYEELFQEVEKVSTVYVKSGDDLYFYTETGDKRKVTDLDERVDILSLFNLYVKISKMMKDGIPIEEIDKTLAKGDFQDQIIDELYQKFSGEQKEELEEETNGVKKISIKTLKKYDELENEKLKGYRNEREKEIYVEALKLLLVKDYKLSSKYANVLDIALIIKAADSLNLYGELADYKQFLLSNSSFFYTLAEYETMSEEEIEELFKEQLRKIDFSTVKPLQKDEKTALERQNYHATSYLMSRFPKREDAKKYIDKLNSIILNAQKNRNRANIKGTVTYPQMVSLLRIVAQRNGFDVNVVNRTEEFFAEIKLFSILANPEILFSEEDIDK